MKQMQDRQKALKPYGRITTEQYYSLNPMEKELHDYWMKEKPEMYQELADSGKLWSLLQSEGNRLYEMVCDLIQEGMSVDQAKEVARAQIYEEIAD